MYIDVTQLFLWFLCFARFGALVFWIPMFSGAQVPTKFRLALAALVSVLVSPILQGTAEIPGHAVIIIIFIAKEILVGALMGMAVRIIFFAVEFGGHIIAQEASLSMAAAIDPTTKSQSNTVSVLLFYLTLFMFMSLGVHHELILAFVRSFDVLPVGFYFPGPGGIEKMIKDTASVFYIGFQIAAPIIAINFVINMAFAVLGKVAPKFNVFMASFPVRIIASLFLLTMILGLVMQYVGAGLERAPEQMLQYLTP